MLPNEKYYLNSIAEFIDHRLQYSILPDSAWYDGYHEALSDLKYACSLSKTALDNHITAWVDFIPLTQEDEGYVQAIKDVAERISEMNKLGEWSYE